MLGYTLIAINVVLSLAFTGWLRRLTIQQLSDEQAAFWWLWVSIGAAASLCFALLVLALASLRLGVKQLRKAIKQLRTPKGRRVLYILLAVGVFVLVPGTAGVMLITKEDTYNVAAAVAEATGSLSSAPGLFLQVLAVMGAYFLSLALPNMAATLPPP